MNGDTLFAPNLARAVERHLRRGAVATMILRHTADPDRFGAIGIDGDGWVRTLLGAPEGRSVTERLMFTGVHILSREAFEAMPELGCVIRTAYREWVDRCAPVLGIVDDSPWADLGTVRDYHRLNLELASGAFRWPDIVPRAGCIVPNGMEPSARIRRSVIGAGATIDERVELDRCVVWPSTRVTRSASGAVLTPKHRLEVS